MHGFDMKSTTWICAVFLAVLAASAAEGPSETERVWFIAGLTDLSKPDKNAGLSKNKLPASQRPVLLWPLAGGP